MSEILRKYKKLFAIAVCAMFVWVSGVVVVSGLLVVRAEAPPNGPVPHTAKYRIVSASQGRDAARSFGIQEDGTLWAWGRNQNGWLGIGNIGDQSSPVQVGIDTDWVHVVTDSHRTYGIRENGRLWGWGANDFGVLGVGNTTTPSYPNPVTIGTGTNWLHVTSNRCEAYFYGFSIGIRGNGSGHGELWAWGSNHYGQLGLGNSGSGTQRTSPTRVGTASNWTHVTAGGGHTLGIRSDGTLWAWGNNVYGQLGVGDRTMRETPTQVGTDTNWAHVEASYYYTIAIRTDGTLWSWGINENGELGLGDNTGRQTPTQVGTYTDWTHISAGSRHGLAIRGEGLLYGWGLGVSRGEHGLGHTNIARSPTRVGTHTDWTQISAGNNHSLGIRGDGKLFVWGGNANGQLGIGITQPSGQHPLSPFGLCLDCDEFPCICPCPHTFPSTWTVTTPATCESDGLESRTCTQPGCDETETQEIPSGGHTMPPTWTTTNPATCTANGLESKTCADCTHTETQVILAIRCNLLTCAECHPPCTVCTWTSWQTVTPSTCTGQGLDQRTCTVAHCDNIETRTISELGHGFAQWQTTTQPTCTSVGIETRHCITCTHPETNILPEDPCGTCEVCDPPIVAPPPDACTPEDPCEEKTCPRCEPLIVYQPPGSDPLSNLIRNPILWALAGIFAIFGILFIIIGVNKRKEKEKKNLSPQKKPS